MTTPDLLVELRRLGGAVSEAHLENALIGRVHPSDDLRRLLPIVLGIPIEACFDEDLLAGEYTGRRHSMTATR